MSDSIFVGTMSLSGTAASAASTPGFRLLYADGYYMHVGGIVVLTPTGITASNAPYTGKNQTLKMVWAVPHDLIEYGETGKMNKGFEAANDLRSYSILFDLFKTDMTDSGNIMLENCLVQKVPRPAPVAPAKEWGGTGTAFNSTYTGWGSSIYPPSGFTSGTVAIAPANMTVAVAGANTGGWASFFPANALDRARPIWTNSRMLRTTYKIASSNPALTPSFRMLTLGTYKMGGMGIGPVIWGDSFSYANARYKVMPAQSPNGLPGAPKTTGSLIELYHASQNAGTGTEEAILTPQYDLCDPGLSFGMAYPINSWQRPSATLTVSSIKMEVLDEASVLP